MGRSIKDSGVEWIGEIPCNWSTSKMKYIGRYVNGYAFKPEDWSSEGKPIIRIQDLTGSNENPNYYDGVLEDKYLVKAGDILVSWAATLDAFIWNKEDGWLNQHIFNAFPDEFIVRREFFFWLIKLAMENMNNDNKHGIMMQHVTLNVFGNFSVPLPPKSEQHRIAIILNSKCAEIDSIISQTRASIEEYKHLKQAVITQAVTKGVRGDRPKKESRYNWIGNYPADWKEIKIKWLLSERKERSVEGLEEPLSMSQKFGLIPTKEMDMIPNMASSFIGAKLVYCGDLVFNKLKAHLGVFSVSCYEGLVSPDYAVYYTTGLADMKFLEYLFKTPQYIAEFRKKSSGVGAGLTRLYTADLYSIYCALPSLDEQREIVMYLQEKCADIDALIAKKEQLLTELEGYKKSLIYEYVTGKKEVPLNVR